MWCDKIAIDLQEQRIHISEMMQPNEECIPLKQLGEFISFSQIFSKVWSKKECVHGKM